MEHLDDPPSAPTEEPARDPSLKTPDEWQKTLFPASERGAPHPEAWKHGAAAALHGWELHAYHTGQPMRLSEADYRAALEAAVTFQPVPGKEGAFTYLPHAPALGEPLRQKERR